MLRRTHRLWRRGLASITDFERLAASHWTSDRASWLSNGHDDPLSPDKPHVAPLLRVLGLLGADGALTKGGHRKYRQLNAMFSAIEHSLAAPLASAKRRQEDPLRLVDLCSGSSSHLALLLAFAARHRWDRAAHVLAVDADPTRIAAAKQRAALLGFGPELLTFATSRVAELPPWSQLYSSTFLRHGSSLDVQPAATAPDGVFALHACDTATDEALAFAVRARAQAVLVAPCCQAELAAAWKQVAGSQAAAREQQRTEGFGRPPPGMGRDGFELIRRQPHLRREIASHVTDAMRVALLRASGYSVEVAEFVSAEHTPKNRLITGVRHRLYARGAAASAARARNTATKEYAALRDATGGCGIALGRLLAVD